MRRSKEFEFGLLNNRFLASSIGILNPQEPLTLTQDSTVGMALELLKENKIGCVVVVDEEGKLRGIFSERDVVLKINYAAPCTDRQLAEVMTRDPKTVTMTTPIAYVLQLMSQGGFRHMPIVDDDGVPVGFVSVKDIVDFIVQSVAWDLESFA